MEQDTSNLTAEWETGPSEWGAHASFDQLLAANVNPDTGLATDFLNLFNEYIMLAELVEDGSMEHDVLSDWLPIDYETHFLRSSFAGAEIVINAYRNLLVDTRKKFEAAIAALIANIMIHQENLAPKPGLMEEIQLQRDAVAAIINQPTPAKPNSCENTQADIDALFD